MVEKKSPANHQKQKCIKMESMAPDTMYAFTFNPADSRNYPNVGSKMIKGNELTPETILIEQITSWKEYLRKMKYCNFAVYPELSPTGRLHFHGFIQITNVLLFYYHDLYILNEYSYEIDTIGPTENDQLKYTEYVFKQKHIWEPLLNKHEFPYRVSDKKTAQKDL